MAKHIRNSRIVALAVGMSLVACAPKGEALYARAETALGKGDVRAAIIDLQALIQSEPDNGKARALLGTALLADGNLSGGAIELERARDLGAPREMLLVPSCRVLAAKGETDKVLSDCKPEAGPAASRADLHMLTGTALLIAHRAPEAKQQFEASLAISPENIDAVLGLADASHQIDGPSAARTVLDAAAAAVKEQPRYWLAVAGLSMLENDYDGAVKAYQSALSKVNKAPNGNDRMMAMGGMAEAQMRQGNIEAADATSKQLLAAAPNSPLVKQLRAQVAAAGGNYEEARTLLEEVVSNQPQNYQARTLLAIVNMQQGNVDQAEMHLAAVVANQPNDARAQSLLAEVRAQQGTAGGNSANLKAALAQTSNDPTMLATAGRLSLASGDREQALVYLAEAAAKSGSDSEPQTQLNVASGYVVAGEFDRAIEILEALPHGGKTEYQREYLLLVSLLRKGDNAAAQTRVNEYVKRSPENARVRELAASVYWAVGEPELSRQQLVAAQKLTPDNLEVHIGLARLALAQGNPKEAEASFQRVLDKDPKHLVATLGMAAAAGARKDVAGSQKWLLKASGDHPDSAEAQLALAQSYLAARDSAKAKAVIDAAVKKSPKNAALANARGVVLLATQDLPGATASFAEAAQLEPTAADYKLNLARAQLLAKDSKGALETIDAALRDKPTNLIALGLAASTSLQAGNLERATGYVERARQAAPDSPISYQLEGDLAFAQKRYKDAGGFYEKADPGGKSRNIVVARFAAGQRAGLREPQKPLEEWLARNPGDTEVIIMLAEWRASHGDRNGAVTMYEQASKSSPDNGVLLNNLAMLYLDAGDGRAVTSAEKAYKLLPNNPAVADTYGWALLKAGKTVPALEILRTAAEGLPGNAEVHYHLAAALAKSGNKAEGLATVKKALGGALSPAARVDAQKLLADLSK